MSLDASGRRAARAGLVFLSLLLLPGCETLGYHADRAQTGLARFLAGGETEDSAQLPPKAAAPQPVRATGYAPISTQPGATPGERMVNAMRVSRLEAYRELAAIIHGRHLFGSTRVRDMTLSNNEFEAAVGGIVRGARVVKSYPVQADTYATILEVDLREVQRAYLDTR